LGVLKKTVEGLEDEFAEAMLPLTEIADEEERIELTKEILNYVAKVMAVHNKRLDDEKISEALKPIFHERAENMVKTIFEEKYLEGEARGIAKGEARGEIRGQMTSVQRVLNARFESVSPKLQKQLSAVTDVSQLENLVGQAAICPTLKDFEKLLGK
jgi:predicted transposase YdaD